MSFSSIHFDESDRFLSRAQVAEIFSVSPSTVTRWADGGKLPYVRTLGGHRRYVKSSILRLLDSRPREDFMERISVDIPAMYGDHHAAEVHQCVAAMPGVEEVWASAASRRLTVTFNPEVVTREAILEQIESSGYPVADGVPDESSLSAPKSALSSTTLRMTQTHIADRKQP